MLFDTFLPPHLSAFIAFAIDSIKAEAIPHYTFLVIGWLLGKCQWRVRLGWQEGIMLAGMLNLSATFVAICVHYWTGQDIMPLAVWFLLSIILMLVCDSVQRDSLLRRTLR